MRLARQIVLHLVPQQHIAQTFFNHFVQVACFGHAQHARAKGHVVVNALREWIGTLKHHAHALAQINYIHFRRINIMLVQKNLAFYARTGNGIVHTIDRAQKGGFAAARRPNEGRDLVFFHRQVEFF